MPKITLTDIVSGYSSQAKLNENFQKLEDILNNNVLFRDNIAPDESNPNWMENDLDMNSYCILNVCDATEVHMAVNYGQLLALINRIEALEDEIALLEPSKVYIQENDPSPTHNSTQPFLWIEVDGTGSPVTFWVEANP